jgi:hypothetical protein
MILSDPEMLSKFTSFMRLLDVGGSLGIGIVVARGGYMAGFALEVILEAGGR